MLNSALPLVDFSLWGATASIKIQYVAQEGTQREKKGLFLGTTGALVIIFIITT